MSPKANPAVTAWCLALLAAWGATGAAARPTAGDPPPSVEAIEQRLADTSQDPELDDDARARIRNLYQQALSAASSASTWRRTGEPGWTGCATSGTASR